MHIALWIVQVLLAAAFGMAGFMKATTPNAELAAMMPWVSDAPVFVPLLAGVSEIAGAVGLILPAALRFKPGLTPLAAIGLLAVMVLATLMHASRGEFESLPVTLSLAALAAFVAWGRMKRAPIAPK